MSKFICPECSHSFEIPFLKWLFIAPVHYFGSRKTKCPNCGKKHWMKPKR